jgi:hypothetical protein
MIGSHIQPNEYLITTLLKMWLYCKDPSLAREKITTLYSYIIESNIVMDAYAVNVLIKALLKVMSPASAMDKVEMMLSRILHFGIIPEMGCFSISIKADPSPRAYERGLRYITMIKNAGRRPSKEVYKSVIFALDKMKQDSETLKAIKLSLTREIAYLEM